MVAIGVQDCGQSVCVPLKRGGGGGVVSSWLFTGDLAGPRHGIGIGFLCSRLYSKVDRLVVLTALAIGGALLGRFSLGRLSPVATEWHLNYRTPPDGSVLDFSVVIPEASQTRIVIRTTWSNSRSVTSVAEG